MKKFLLLIGFIGAALFTAEAQEYKPVKIGLGLGYASPGGEGAKGGVLVYFEPAYRVNDALAVGLRIESAVMAQGVTFSGSGQLQLLLRQRYLVMLLTRLMVNTIFQITRLDHLLD